MRKNKHTCTSLLWACDVGVPVRAWARLGRCPIPHLPNTLRGAFKKTGARRRRPNGRAAVGMRRHADALPCRVFMPLVPTGGGAYRAARARHPAFMPWQWRRNRPGAFLLAGRPPHELAKMA